MVRQLKCLLLCLILPVTAALQAQVPEEVRLTIERYLETLETNADYTQIYEDLTAFLDKPVRLNKAGTDELLNFPLMSPVQATALVAHREKHGPLLHLSELQVLGFSPEQIRALAPFVTLSTGTEGEIRRLGALLKVGRQEAVLTAKRRFPDPEDPYSGDLLGSSLRLRYTLSGRYSFGLTAEKDPGERWWRRGPDFYSGHAAIFNTGRIKSAVAGDYLLSIGQGLVMGSGIGIGKSAAVLNIKRTQPMVKPYRGVNEFLFLRGAAATVSLGKLELTTAAAFNTLDARIGDTAIFGDISFSSVDLDGLHRNNDEISGKGNLRRRTLGAWLSRNGRKGQFGGGLTSMNASLPPETDDRLYKLYNPTGRNSTFLHAWQGHTLGRVHFFSEWARLLETGKHAIAAGMLMSLGRWAELALHYRDYAPGFISPYSTSFGNSNQNERGFYTGIKFNFNKKISLSHYTDFWQQPWLTFRLNAPSRNREMLWQLDYQPTRKTQMYVRYRNMTRAISETAGPMKGIGEYTVQLLRVHLSAAISDQSRLEFRAEHSVNNSQGAKGHSSLYYSEFTGKLPKYRLQVIARYTLFSISDYYNRLYAYENQLLYDFGTVAFYGKGRSAYLLLQKNLSRHLKAGLRYAWTESVNDPGEAAVWNRRVFVQIIWRRG